MKLVRFGKAGSEKPGIVDADGVIRDVSSLVTDFAGDALSSRNLAKLKKVDLKSLPAVRKGTRLGSCVARPGNFIAVGLNFADHAAETGARRPERADPLQQGPELRRQGPDDDIEFRKDSKKTDWEVELAIVIGKKALYIEEKDALSYVAGFCICNDVSEREFQPERGGQWMKGKGSPTFGPAGSLAGHARRDQGRAEPRMWLELNGKKVQNGSSKTMIFGCAHLVAYISRSCTRSRRCHHDGHASRRRPWHEAPEFLKRGDTMRVGIEGLGVQSQKVIAWND